MTLPERAQSAQESLFARYDRLNDLWSKVEKRLASRHVPVPVVIEYSDSEYDPSLPAEDQLECKLGLLKMRGEWRICHSRYHGQDPRPIVECSAQERIDAAEYIDLLEERLLESSEAFVPKVDIALAQLQDYLDATG